MTPNVNFSTFPDWLMGDGEEAAPTRFRPLGTRREDLEINFNSVRRPELVTCVLARCLETSNGTQPGHDLLMRMPVGLRIDALLRLASITDERPFEWKMRCTQPACGQESEFELSIHQILNGVRTPWQQATTSVAVGPFQLTVARPTAADQMNWIAAGEVEASRMFRDIVQQPPVEQVLAAGISPESLAHAIDAAMEEFDPLLDFHFTFECPHCGATNTAAPDLVAAALDRLALGQQKLIEEVHRLATRYHWTEPQILELPQWRRQSYLELIEEEVA